MEIRRWFGRFQQIKTTWQDVPPEPNNETNIHILKRNNGQAAELLLTQTLYYRAKFTYRDTGAGGSSDASYVGDYDLDFINGSYYTNINK